MESKKVKVILLPTGKDGWNKGDILKCTGESPAKHRKGHISLSIKGCEAYSNLTIMYKAHYMYLISNDFIKEEEWYYSTSFNGVYQAKSDDLIDKSIRRDFKIEATNNPGLTTDGISGISLSDIKWWVDNGCPEEILLKQIEYAHCCQHPTDVRHYSDCWYCKNIEKHCKLKISDNNEVEFMKPQYKIEGGLPKDNKDGTYSTTPIKVVEINQKRETVEEAANSFADAISIYEEISYSHVGDAFKAGAEWKEQQSANDAIEFAEFIRSDNTWNKVLPTYKSPGWINIHTLEVLTSKELYKLWKSKQ
jgi:hypothetical protein